MTRNITRFNDKILETKSNIYKYKIFIKRISLIIRQTILKYFHLYLMRINNLFQMEEVSKIESLP